ncbi:MAG: hypothetical protein NVSMB22_20360 [Chloroflexota bacterium]
MSSRPWRALFVFVFALIGLAAPASTQAGGGVAPGGKGGGSAPAGKIGESAPGGGVSAAAVVTVDHTTVAGHAFDFLDFYPRSTTVHSGDTVNFHWVESNGNTFHTVTFVPANTNLKSQAVARLAAAGGAPSPDPDDGPGPPIINFNVLQKPCGSSAYFPSTAPCVYDGHSIVNSGVFFPNAISETGKFLPSSPLHFSVKMNVPAGIYRYFCLVHGPEMNGTIRVAPAGTPLPSQAQQVQASNTQFQTEKAAALAAVASVPAPAPQTQGSHSTWALTAGVGSRTLSGVEIEEYSARHISIKAGDTVVWQPRGFHTVSFPRFLGIPAIGAACESTHPGPDRPFRGSFAGCNFESTLGRGAIPSGPSGGPYTGGFSTSGILVVPRPHTWAVTFPKAGTYRYQCLIHWGMYGAITVQ